MELEITNKMDKKFHALYYALIGILVLVFAYNMFLFFAIMFDLNDFGLSEIYLKALN